MQAGNKDPNAPGRDAAAYGAAVRGRRTRADRERQALNSARFPWDSTSLPSSGPGRTRHLPGVPSQQGNPETEGGRASTDDIQIAGLKVYASQVSG